MVKSDESRERPTSEDSDSGEGGPGSNCTDEGVHDNPRGTGNVTED